jgi:hypothetical protein
VTAGGRTLAQTLRVNTTISSPNLGWNNLRWRGAGVTAGGRTLQALAQILRVNTTISSLNLGWNNLGEGGERALAEALRVNTTLTSLEGKL